MEDSEIIEMYCMRNELALYETKAKYGRRIYALALRITNSSEDAEECENDTYMRMWTKIPEKIPQHLYAYSMRVCKNISLRRIEYRKRYKRDAVIVELTDEMEGQMTVGSAHTVDEYENEREILRVVCEFLNRLTKIQQAVFLKRCMDRLPVNRIADDLNIRSGNVGTMLFRMRQKLLGELRKEDIYI